MTANQTKIFLIKLDKAVQRKKVIVGRENCKGIILYLRGGYYQFSKIHEYIRQPILGVNEVDRVGAEDRGSGVGDKKLQEVIHPVKFWDTLFAMDTSDSTILEYWIPSKFCCNMFSINSDLRIRLNESYPILGVYSNTSAHPNCYQFKIVSQDTESVCSDKSIAEIHKIAEMFRISLPQFKNKKCRNQLVEVVLNDMKNRNLFLPWTPGKRPR